MQCSRFVAQTMSNFELNLVISNKLMLNSFFIKLNGMKGKLVYKHCSSNSQFKPRIIETRLLLIVELILFLPY